MYLVDEKDSLATLFLLPSSLV